MTIKVWESNLNKLKKFKKKFGHTNVPSKWKDTTLALWTENIRKRKNQLPGELKKALGKLGFDFNYKESEDWNIMYDELKHFYQTHGHTVVSAERNKELYDWTDRQRQTYRWLSPAQVKKLDGIEFLWELRSARYMSGWLRGYEKLKAFYQKHGTSEVPWANQSLSLLHSWNVTQVKQYRKGKLSDDKIKLLEAIEFNFNMGRKGNAERFWTKRYEELKKFKETHGHCRIPSGKKELRSLYN